MYTQLKKNIKDLVDVSDEDFNAFIAFLKPISIKKRTNILKQGEKPQSMYFVNSGLLYNYHLTANGEQHVAQIAKENFWVGDISGHANNPSSNFNIEALEDSNLLELEFTAFDQACKEIPIFERYFRLLIQNAYYHMLNRLVLTDVQSAKGTVF